MTRLSRRALWALLLLAGGARAAVVEVRLAPAPLTAAAPALPLGAPSSVVPALPTAVALPAAPSVFLAPAAAKPVAGALPKAGAARSPLAAAIAAAAPSAEPQDGAESAAYSAGKLFELAAARSAGDVLRSEFPGVVFQNEQEGSLRAADPRDSSGNVFRYYRPSELRPELLARAAAELSGVDRLIHSAVTWGGRRTRGKPLKAWEALPLRGKLRYLALLDDAVDRERGADAAWRGKSFLLLERSPGAPEFVADHPDMESPPAGWTVEGGARFLQPEIVSHRDRPARTAAEALSRTRLVIAETGHAGTQYHAFFTLDTERLERILPRLMAAVQALNDDLYLEAARESPDNLFHGSLKPWHAGRSNRVAALIAARSPAPHQPSAGDFDSEKHAFLGVRYWGTVDGRTTVSLELRGASLPWTRESSQGLRFEGGNVGSAHRDYSGLERRLAQVALLADRARNGELPEARGDPPILDADAAVRTLSELSVARGGPQVTSRDLEQLSAALGAGPGVHPSLLFPLARGGARAYAEELWRQALARRAHGGEFNARFARYSLWTAFASWAAGQPTLDR
ncbi:MAG: hypothetical protein HY553_14730 [Elusimicrobia bacterium]|nr:hypothetical protein [Elusimicrobiota bacterium]